MHDQRDVIPEARTRASNRHSLASTLTGSGFFIPVNARYAPGQTKYLMRLPFRLALRLFQNTLLTIVLFVFCSWAARAVDVNFYYVQKAQKYNQSSAGPPIPGSGNPYRFEAGVAPSVTGSVEGGTVSASGIPPQALTFDPVFEWYSFTAKFPSQAALDAAAPAGNYTLVVSTVNQGQKTLTLNLPAESFPAGPHISNWTAGQAINPTADFTLKWDTFAGGTTNDFILVLMGDTNSALVFRSPDPFKPGALKGTATSVVIPAANLQPSTPYLLEITFVKTKSLNTTSYPGAVGVVGFNSLTDTGLMTTTNPIAPVQFAFSLRHFAQGGSFLNDTNATPKFPVAINGYRAELIVTGTTNFASPTQVFFTGPARSGLTNTSSGPNGFTLSGDEGLYFSPKINQPPLAPAGAYSVSYQGTLANFIEPDPQASSHLIIPVPQVSLSNGAVASVAWRLYDPNGNAILATPAVLSAIHLQQLDSSGSVIYNSVPLAPSTASYTFTNSLPWTNLTALRFLNIDTLTNSYIITYPNVLVTTPTQLSAITYSPSGFIMQLSGQAGHSYRVQSSTDFANWSDLLTTNLSSATVELVDPQVAGSASRFYRAALSN